MKYGSRKSQKVLLQPNLSQGNLTEGHQHILSNCKRSEMVLPTIGADYKQIQRCCSFRDTQFSLVYPPLIRITHPSPKKFLNVYIRFFTFTFPQHLPGGHSFALFSRFSSRYTVQVKKKKASEMKSFYLSTDWVVAKAVPGAALVAFILQRLGLVILLIMLL